MANRWEVEITDLDSACVTDGIELVNVYTLKLSASNAAEAKHAALGLWNSEYPLLTRHDTDVKSRQIYERSWWDEIISPRLAGRAPWPTRSPSP